MDLNVNIADDFYLGSNHVERIYYNNELIWPFSNYSREYFTIEPLENGTITFTKCVLPNSTPSSSYPWHGNNTVGTLYYSTDKQNWTVLSAPTDFYSSSLNVTAGQNVYFKGDLFACNRDSSGNYPGGIGTFSSTCKFNASGNTMSLFFEDNFINKKSFDGIPNGYQQTYAGGLLARLFKNCDKIINANNLILPATALYTYSFYDKHWESDESNSCKFVYYEMFMNCTSLVSAPQDLPAKGQIADNVYQRMFYGCTSLSVTPQINPLIVQIGGDALKEMFKNCTSLEYAPIIIGTRNEHYYCYEMFANCTSLKQAPQLPSMKFNNYTGMFRNCTSLTTAPILHFGTPEYQYGYQNPSDLTEMFYGCTSLTNITCIIEDSTLPITTDWVKSVSSTGTFTKTTNGTWSTGDSGIPNDWTINNVYIDYSQEYLTLEALESTIFTWKDNAHNRSIYYSTDNGSTWTILTSGSSTPTIATNDKILLKANLGAGTSSSGNGTISSSGKFNAMGNIMSLQDGDNFINSTTIANDYQFCKLFAGCNNLIDAYNLILPATTLTTGCYSKMFISCTKLLYPTVLPSMTLASYCYNEMFRYCISLVYCPELPATTVAPYCYSYMFSDCTSLSGNTPDLHATTLATGCYQYMYSGCTSITSAVNSLAVATTLADYCYAGMFKGCTEFFYTSGLPATILAPYCYYEMFKDCPKFDWLKCLATDISASNCTTNWLNGVAQTGTFIKEYNVQWPSGASGIPSGWTVQDA